MKTQNIAVRAFLVVSVVFVVFATLTGVIANLENMDWFYDITIRLYLVAFSAYAASVFLQIASRITHKILSAINEIFTTLLGVVGLPAEDYDKETGYP